LIGPRHLNPTILTNNSVFFKIYILIFVIFIPFE
jgi:hypothetical protein